jgi:hypothetical protein
MVSVYRRCGRARNTRRLFTPLCRACDGHGTGRATSAPACCRRRGCRGGFPTKSSVVTALQALAPPSVLARSQRPTGPLIRVAQGTERSTTHDLRTKPNCVSTTEPPGAESHSDAQETQKTHVVLLMTQRSRSAMSGSGFEVGCTYCPIAKEHRPGFGRRLLPHERQAAFLERLTSRGRGEPGFRYPVRFRSAGVWCTYLELTGLPN